MDKEILKEMRKIIREEIGEVKVEVKELREDVNELKQDVRGLKQDVSEINKRILPALRKRLVFFFTSGYPGPCIPDTLSVTETSSILCALLCCTL